MLSHAATSAEDGALDFVSFAPDTGTGFKTIVDVQFGHDLRVSWIALGGTSITNATVNTFTLPSTADSDFDVTNAGFDPDFIMFLLASGSAAETINDDSDLHIGASTGSSEQITYSSAAWDAEATAITRSYATDIQCISRGTGDAVQVRVQLTSFAPDTGNGCKLNVVESNFGYVCAYLALQGGDYLVGNGTTATDTTEFNATGALSFNPAGGLFISANRAEDSDDTTTNVQQASIGVFSSTDSGDQVAHVLRDNNGSTGAESSTGIRYGSVYANLDSSGAIQGEGAVSSMGSSGVFLTMSDADPGASWFGYVLFGPADSGIAPTVGPLVLGGTAGRLDSGVKPGTMIRGS